MDILGLTFVCFFLAVILLIPWWTPPDPPGRAMPEEVQRHLEAEARKRARREAALPARRARWMFYAILLSASALVLSFNHYPWLLVTGVALAAIAAWGWWSALDQEVKERRASAPKKNAPPAAPL